MAALITLARRSLPRLGAGELLSLASRAVSESIPDSPAHRLVLRWEELPA